MEKKEGFTLVELLVVIMIMGIILGIAIPAVVNLQKSQMAKKFDYFRTIIGEAVDLYVEQYGKSFDETETCFDISYDSLVEEDLIQESDITCLSSEGQQGVIQATRIPGTNNFTYEYFLNCKDRSTGEILSQSGTPSAGCKGVNGNFIVNIDSAVKIVDGVTSDYTLDTWTRGKVIVTLSSVNPYYYDIDHYEYSLDGNNYSRITGNQVTFDDVNGKVYFRAVDTNSNYSGDTIAMIKIDNDKPTAKIRISGTKGSNDWYTSNITASCEDQSDGSGSGVASCTVTPESINQNTSGTQITLTIKDNAGNTNVVTQSVKIDKNSPIAGNIILTGTKGNNNWYISNVTVSASACQGSVSGCTSSLSTTSITSDTKSTTITLTVTGGNGKKATKTTTVKVDKTKPTCRTSTSGNGTSSVTITGTCSDSTSSCTKTTVSTIKTTGGTYSPGTVTDNAGNSTTCPSTTISTKVLLASVAKVGDFVDYDAGNWTSSAAKPTTHGSFGGYTSGTSRGSAPNCSDYGTNRYSGGWMVMSNDGTTVKLISAGTPLCYYHQWLWEDYSAQNSAQTIRNYNWSQFNNSYASSSTILTKEIIDGVVGRDTNATYVTGVWVIGASYLLADPYRYEVKDIRTIHDLYGVGGPLTSTSVNNTYDTSYGLRPVITLKTNTYTTGKNSSGSWTLTT